MRARAVSTVVVVGLLIAGAGVADVVLRERTEDRLASELQQEVPGLTAAPDVTITGFPFLTQVLGGELDDVRVTAPSATVDGLRLDRVDVRLTGVSTRGPTAVDRAELTAVVTPAALQQVLTVPVELSVDGAHLVAATELVGILVEVLLLPRAARRAIEVDVDGVRVGGATVAAQDLPSAVTDQLQGLSLPVEQLPRGVELTGLTVESDGVHLRAAGTDVVLE